jgi:hypothetical protein
MPVHLFLLECEFDPDQTIFSLRAAMFLYLGSTLDELEAVSFIVVGEVPFEV